MTTSTVTPEIAEFAQGVRAALADLPAEEVDDLTEGLEADLAEAYAEDLQRELPDPAAYASELRAAAGLPVRTKARTGVFSGLAQGWKDTRADITIAIRRNPALASAVDLLGELRPVWWVARAWLAAWLVAAFFNNDRGYGMAGTWWLVLIAFVIISVQWGRGRWHGAGVPALIAVGNVVAVVALLPVLAAADDGDGRQYGAGFEDGLNAAQQDPPNDGLSFNGHPIENVYPYDAKGRPLSNVQLFDVDGKPLVPFRNPEVTSLLQAPARLETGVEAYNVYPLNITKVIYNEAGELVPDPHPDVDKVKAYTNGPFVKVPAVQTPEKVAKSNE
jgi:hypothetical protein